MPVTYRDWRFNILHIGLFDQDLFCPLAERLDLAFFDVLALLQLFNPLIEIVLIALLRHSKYFS